MATKAETQSSAEEHRHARNGETYDELRSDDDFWRYDDEDLTPRQRARQAHRIIRRQMLWGAAAGVIPFPIVDLAAVTAVQLTMLSRLCRLYRVNYHEDRGREWIGALVGSITPTYLKAVPGFFTIGILTGPVFYAASTYAVGKVFVQHFETGGTLLTFNADRMREYFERYYREGRDVASKVA